MTCNEFALGQFQCPESCPIWVPNPVWKCVGACIRTDDDCYLYNPMLHYADSKSNRCLPCTIPGCISCQVYTDSIFSAPSWDHGISSLDTLSHDKLSYYKNNSLVDMRMNCYKCAKGYILSDDKSKCIYKPSLIWNKTRTFFKFIAILCSVLALTIILRLVKPNIKLLRAAIRNSEKFKFYRDKNLYPLSTNLNKDNVAGIGILYYFRRLHSSTIVILVLALSSLCREGPSYSKFIRSNNVTLSLDTDGKHIFSGESLFETKDTCLDLLNTDIKGHKNVSDISSTYYMNSYYFISIASYITVLFLTIIFAFPDAQEKLAHVTDSSCVVILVSGLSKHLDTEGKIEDHYEMMTGIRPVAVVCYDYKGYYNRVVDLVIEQNKYLQGYSDEDLSGNDTISSCQTAINNKTTIVKLMNGGSGGSLEEFEIINAVKPTGKAYLQFQKSNRNVERLLSKHECIKLLDDIDWGSFSENNVPFRPILFILCCIVIICIWIFLFYIPYAFYSLSDLNLWGGKGDRFTATLCTTLFVRIGQMLVSNSICYLTRFIGFASKSKSDSFQLLTLYSFQLVNLLLNSLVTHLNKYGGQMKLFSLFNYHKKNDGLPQSLLLAEEVSLSKSISIYILPTLVIVPNVMDPLYTYLIPFCISSIYILCSDMKLSKACKLIKPPKIELVNAYSTLLVNLTSAFFLQFLIHDTWESFFSLIALALLFICLSYINTYLLLRHSAKASYNSPTIDDMALKIWAFPTGILAASPGYWLWRMGRSPLIMIISFLGHVSLYILFIVYIKPHINLKLPRQIASFNTSTASTGKGPLPYSTSPMHVLKSFAKLNSNRLLGSSSGQLESQLLVLSKLDLTTQLHYYQGDEDGLEHGKTTPSDGDEYKIV